MLKTDGKQKHTARHPVQPRGGIVHHVEQQIPVAHVVGSESCLSVYVPAHSGTGLWGWLGLAGWLAGCGCWLGFGVIRWLIGDCAGWFWLGLVVCCVGGLLGKCNRVHHWMQVFLPSCSCLFSALETCICRCASPQNPGATGCGDPHERFPVALFVLQGIKENVDAAVIQLRANVLRPTHHQSLSITDLT